MNYTIYEQKFRTKAVDAGYSEDNIQKCLKYAKPLIDTGFPVIYNSSNLAALVGYKRSYIKRAIFFTEYFYREFNIKKKNGNLRAIKEPLPSLKEIQQWILNDILYNVPTSRFAKAYIPQKTLIDNVKFHKGQDKVVCIDLKDFFPSITKEHVIAIFKEIGYSSRVSGTLASLCCLNDSLPQGAPTSPQLSNIYMRDFDNIISDHCTKNKIRYTRYADDLTFSGNFNENELLEIIEKEVGRKHLSINTSKTKIMTRNMRQIVTGVMVNSKLQVPKEKRREIRQAIFFIKKFGLTKHLENIQCFRANYLKHLLGLVNFVLFINPEDKEAIDQKKYLQELLKN